MSWRTVPSSMQHGGMRALHKVLWWSAAGMLSGCGLVLDWREEPGDAATPMDARDAFTTDAFTTDAFATDAFATDAFATDAFATDAVAADAFATDAFATDAFAAVPVDASRDAAMRSDGGVPGCLTSAVDLLAAYPFDGLNDTGSRHPILGASPPVFLEPPLRRIAVFSTSTDAYISAFEGIRGVSVWVRPYSEPAGEDRRGIVNVVSTLGLFQHNGEYHCWFGSVPTPDAPLHKAVLAGGRTGEWALLRCWIDDANQTHLTVGVAEIVQASANRPPTSGEVRLGADADDAVGFDEHFEGEMTELRFWAGEPPNCLR